MLIATFGPSTGWQGKTITHENEGFVLEGHGPIAAAAVMEYDRQGHLLWANEGMRAWVGAKAQAAPKPSPAAAQPSRRSNESKDMRTEGQKAAGLGGVALLVIGLLVVGYFFLVLDVSVPTAMGRVNNIGLMDDRQNGIIVGLGMMVGGGVLMYIGRMRKPDSRPASQGATVAQAPCHSCRNQVVVGSAFCPHCGAPLNWSTGS